MNKLLDRALAQVPQQTMSEVDRKVSSMKEIEKSIKQRNIGLTVDLLRSLNDKLEGLEKRLSNR
jgi:hypothetical protein